MKTLTVLALTLLVSTSAFARATKFYTIDMSGKRFVDNTFNNMDDGLPSEVDGVQVKLSGEIDVDFQITVSPSTPELKDCAIGRSKLISNFTLVELLGSPDVDTGDTCDYTIVYKNGRKAVLNVLSEGT